MHKPNTDTIARLVNAHMDAMGAAIDAAFTASVVSDTDKPAAREAMHRLAASARQHLHHLAMELAGGAAYARPEPSPQPAGPAAVAERVEYTSPFGSGVLEERAPAPDVVAQCRAAEPTPAPREPDGWVVVYESGRGGPAWLVSDEHAEMNARNYAVGIGTARPFWLDTPPVHPSSLTDVVTTLEDERDALRAEVERLRAALRAIAMTVGASVGERATTDLHCAVADEVRLVVERLTRERDAALALARQCRDVALGERERIAGALRGMGMSASGSVVPEICAPTLPEVP